MQQASLKANQQWGLEKELAHISSYLTLSEDKYLQTNEPQTKLKIKWSK
jgi:hypothetical protein